MANEPQGSALPPQGGVPPRRFTRPLVSLAVNVVAPSLLYFALTAAGQSDFAALAVATAVPAVWTIARWLIRRRIDWIAAFATVGYALSLAASLLLGGGTLLLKAHGVLLTGPLGLVLLVSALMGRPLLLVLVRLIAPDALVGRPAAQPGQPTGNPSRLATVATVVLGVACLVHAGVNLALAALPTQEYLLVKDPVTLVLLAATVGVLLLVRGKLLRR